jgi:hypothetical protein
MPLTGDGLSRAPAHARRHHLVDHSGLAPENLTTLAHFWVSSAMSLPKSKGDG